MLVSVLVQHPLLLLGTAAVCCLNHNLADLLYPGSDSKHSACQRGVKRGFCGIVRGLSEHCGRVVRRVMGTAVKFYEDVGKGVRGSALKDVGSIFG